MGRSFEPSSDAKIKNKEVLEYKVAQHSNTVRSIGRNGIRQLATGEGFLSLRCNLRDFRGRNMARRVGEGTCGVRK